MIFTIRIETRPDTFGDNTADEIRRILRDELRLDDVFEYGRQLLFDVDSNHVGSVTYTGKPEPVAAT